MKIVFFSIFDNFGGAAIAAFMLESVLNKNKIKLNALVLQKKSHSDLVVSLVYNLFLRKLAMLRFDQDRYQFFLYENLKVSENRLELNNLYLYDKKTKENSVILNDVKNKSRITISKQLYSLAKYFRGYEVLNKFAEHSSLKIYNASIKNYIDTF